MERLIACLSSEGFQEDESKGFEVFPQRDGNDGEVGAQGEYREKGQEIAQYSQDLVANVKSTGKLREEIQGIYIVQLLEGKEESSSICQEHVKAQDEREVHKDETKYSLLGFHRCDHPRQRMLTHERIDAHAK